MELHLILKTLSIFMVTYLPTILMNIINQAANYIKGEDRYQIILELNITSMMVLASIYLSVSNSLPGSSNIKPIEIWLLFNLAYPFLVIIVNILLQVQAMLNRILRANDLQQSILVDFQYFEKPSISRTRVDGKEKKDKKEVKTYARDVHISILKVTSQLINPLVYIIFSVIYLYVYY